MLVFSVKQESDVHAIGTHSSFRTTVHVARALGAGCPRRRRGFLDRFGGTHAVDEGAAFPGSFLEAVRTVVNPTGSRFRFHVVGGESEKGVRTGKGTVR